MKYFAIILVLLLVALSACSSQQLPPEPVAPGSVGNYYYYIGDWASEPLNFQLTSNDYITCSLGEDVPISFQTVGDDYVYKYWYLYDPVSDDWFESDFTVKEEVPNSNWLKGDAFFYQNIPCETLSLAADENNEAFAVGYSCSWDDILRDWDCHDNKWQLNIFEVIVVDTPVPKSCTDSDGIDYTAKGTTLVNDVPYTDFCNGDSVLEYGCTADLALIEDTEFCLFGCFDGRCLPNPDDPSAPGSTGGTNSSTNSTSGTGDALAITGFTLIDAVSETVIASISDGVTLDVSNYDVSQLAIEALTSSDTQSVVLSLNGGSPRTESVPPYTLFGDNGDGTDYYGGNIPLGTHSVTATAYESDGAAGASGTPVTFTFTLIDGIAGCTIAEASNYNSQATTDDGSCVLPVTSGVSYREYPGNYDVIADFASQDMTARATTKFTSAIGIPSSSPSDFIGLVLDAQLDVPTTGTYTFYLTSDDGSTLFVNGAQVINNDGLHAEVTESTTVSLNAGRVPITVYFFEKDGGQVLTLEYEGPGISRQVIPASTLNRALYGCMNPSDGNYNQYASHSDSSQCAVIVTSENGVCGSNVNSCSAGTFVDQSDTSSQYVWQCSGVNGGTTASCSRSKTSPPPSGNGLFHSDDEIAIWNDRRVNGPYEDQWQRIDDRVSQFMNGQLDSNPWVGASSSSNWMNSNCENMLPGRTRHAAIRDAAFKSLLLQKAGQTVEAQQLRQAARDAIIAQINQPGVDFSNAAIWSSSTYEKDGCIHDLVNWIRRIAIGYSFIRSELDSADVNKIDSWLYEAAHHWKNHLSWYRGYRFTSWDNIDNCDGGFCPGERKHALYYGGPTWYQFHSGWNNRPTTVAALTAVVGVLLDDAELQSMSKQWVKDWVRYSVWPNGVVVDQHRWYESIVSQGHGYPLEAIGSILTIADVFARQGDTSLYDFETYGGKWGTQVTSGEPKSILTAMKHYAGQVDGSIIEYASVTPTSDANKVIDSDIIETDGEHMQTVYDVLLSQGNVYYRDNSVQESYTRRAPGAPSYPRYVDSAGYDAYSGDWGSYPNVLFMFGDMENTVWPYEGKPQSDGGLLWTPELVAAWKDRAQNGPYKSRGDAFTNSPPEWENIVAAKNRFMNNPTADRLTPTEQNIFKFTVISDKEMTELKAKLGTNSPSMSEWGLVHEHNDMREAALYGLIMNDQNVITAVKNELLWHARQSHLQAPNDYSYRMNGEAYHTDIWNWLLSEYLARPTVIADLLQHEFSASEWQELRSWLLPWAEVFEEMVHGSLSELYVDRYNENWQVSKTGISNRYTHKDSSGNLVNRITTLGYFYNNRKSSPVVFFSLAGGIFDSPLLVDRAELYVKEFLQFAVYSDGMQGESERNQIDLPSLGSYAYGASNIFASNIVSFVLWRTRGDTSLYEYSTCNGFGDTKDTQCSSRKDLSLVINTHLDLLDRNVEYYYDRAPSLTEQYRISSLKKPDVNDYRDQFIAEMLYAPMANMYYKNPRVTYSYTRQDPKSPPFDDDSNAGRLTTHGNGAQMPSMLFMYGELEGVVN